MGCLEAERLEVPIPEVLGTCRFCNRQVTSENGKVVFPVDSWDGETYRTVQHFAEFCSGSPT